MMEVTIALAILLIIAILIGRASSSASKVSEDEKLLENLKQENLTYLQNDVQEGLLSISPPIGSINLKAGEYIVLQEAVELYEERKTGYHAGTSVRITKGIYVRGGASKSVGSLTNIDHGILYLTTARLIFAGQLATRSTYLSKIFSLSVYKDMITIHREGKSKSESYALAIPMEFKILFEAVLAGGYTQLDDYRLIKEALLKKGTKWQEHHNEWLLGQQSGKDHPTHSDEHIETTMPSDDDYLYDEALEYALQHPVKGILDLQRGLRLGYTRASKLFARLENEGVIGPNKRIPD